MEDYLLYFIVAGIIGLITVALSLFLNQSKKPDKPAAERPAENVNAQRARNARVPPRRVGVRRPRQNILDSEDEEDNAGGGGGGGGGEGQAEDSDAELEAMLNDPKLGAKKREKLKAKAEKRAHREAEERLREEKKKQDAKKEEERRKAEELEAENERLREEEEKKRKEEQARRDEEEYRKLVESFTVEGEGCDVADDEEEENLLEKFVNHIKAKKVIPFEELATQFNLKVPDAIDRVNQLVASERITGVMDDRGKFIYISEEELNKFAKFIKQRGRVSIAEIVDNSTSIINIVPDQPVSVN